MPELPEVEVVKRSLNNKIQNLIIKNVKINDSKLRYRVKKNHIRKLIGLKIIKIRRKAKFLLFILEKNIVILVHLGMTGKFFFADKQNIKYKTSFYYDLYKKKDRKYDRLVFFLSGKQKLIYNDVRKFGFIKILDQIKLKKNFHLKNLGPEPLSKKFNFKYFKKYLVKRRRTIKEILMDQKFVSGLGNIYVNEVLFKSKIKPMKKAHLIKDKDIKNIQKNIKKILQLAIKLGGSSLRDFSSSNGKKGNFQQYFCVYGKKGSNCSNKNCNSKILKIEISNRATFYCKNCQK